MSTTVKIRFGELQCSVAIPSSTVSHMAEPAECLDPTRVGRVIRRDVEIVQYRTLGRLNQRQNHIHYMFMTIA